MRTPKNVISGVQLPAVLGSALYTVPSNTSIQLSQLSVVNTTATARWFTLYLIPQGGSADASTTIVFQRVVGAGRAYPVPEAINRILEAGGTINAIAEAASAITLAASGFETVIES